MYYKPTLQSQTAVSAYFSSISAYLKRKQMLPFNFARQIYILIIMMRLCISGILKSHTLILFIYKMCIHLKTGTPVIF